MRLFDPPFEKVRKKLPTGVAAQFERVRARADIETPIDLSATQRGLVIGFVTAAWALGEHNHGRIYLSDYDGRYISNLGTNCANMLGARQYLATAITRTLIDEGLIAEN